MARKQRKRVWHGQLEAALRYMGACPEALDKAMEYARRFGKFEDAWAALPDEVNYGDDYRHGQFMGAWLVAALVDRGHYAWGAPARKIVDTWTAAEVLRAIKKKAAKGWG